MSRLIYSMGVSLDGFIAGPAGEIDWSAPGEELHRFHNQETRELGAHLCGRRLYEEMVFWETADQNAAAAEHELEFARLWQALPKVVFSTTLERVEGNARLAEGRAEEEVARLKERTDGDLAVGGAGLASTFIRLGLVDEYRLFVSPVVLGAGTPFFPAGSERIDLELVETRTFPDRVVYLRYARPGGLTLEMRRMLPAAASVVFGAFADAGELARWWGPTGFSVPSLEFAPREGAPYRIEMQPPEGDSFALAGAFLAVDAPARLAFTFAWEPPDPDDVVTRVDLSFRDLGGATELSLTQGPFKTQERRALHRDGWTDSLDRLERLLT
jgi:uncharacterized protein YndB with AHSA1/START domain